MSAAASETVRFVAAAASEIRDGDVCFVGIGIPSLAAMTAKRTHAPNAVLIYESGAIDSNPPVPPLSTGSPAVVADTAMIGSCLDVFALLQRGGIDKGLLSAAQMDRFGNLNSTSINRRDGSRLRLVGSGGALDIALLAREVMIMMPADARRFVDKVDFVTSPGLGVPRPPHARGPSLLVTPQARFTFETGEVTLDAVAEGLDEDAAVSCFPWQPPRKTPVDRLPAPGPELLSVASELLAAWGRDLS